MREPAVLELMDAYGIGRALYPALNLFQWNCAARVPFSIFAVVVMVEIAVTQIWKWIL